MSDDWANAARWVFTITIMLTYPIECFVTREVCIFKKKTFLTIIKKICICVFSKQFKITRFFYFNMKKNRCREI